MPRAGVLDALCCGRRGLPPGSWYTAQLFVNAAAQYEPANVWQTVVTMSHLLGPGKACLLLFAESGPGAYAFSSLLWYAHYVLAQAGL